MLKFPYPFTNKGTRNENFNRQCNGDGWAKRAARMPACGGCGRSGGAGTFADEPTAKLKQLVASDLFNAEEILRSVQDYDAYFYCLGVASSGMTEDEYRRITQDLTLAVAEQLPANNPAMRFIYISGSGADSSEQGKTMWARMRGRGVPYRPKRGRLADLSRPKWLDTVRVAGTGGVCDDGRAVALRHAKHHQPATPCPALYRTARTCRLFRLPRNMACAASLYRMGSGRFEQAIYRLQSGTCRYADADADTGRHGRQPRPRVHCAGAILYRAASAQRHTQTR